MEQKTSKELSIGLQLDKLDHTLQEATESLKHFKKLSKDSNELREYAIDAITKFALSVRSSKLDKDELENFFKYPYCIIQGKNEREHYLIIPKFVDAHFGWLHKVTPSHNIFLVNPYVDWLGELPAALKKELKIPDPLDIYLEGEYLTGSDTAKAETKFKEFIKRKERDGRLLIDKSRHFEFLARLIKEGILPFRPQPINPDDLVDLKCDFTLRDYQEEAWKGLLEYSNIGVFFPPSTGKTWFGMYVITHLKGPHLITVPSTILIEQWVERIETYTDLRVGWWETPSQRNHVLKELEEGKIDVIVTTYQSAIKYCSTFSWAALLVDEAHHMPANLFSKLATMKRKYMIGLSATPQREDGREEFIFALTGKPFGLSWDNFKRLGIISNPTLHVWIVKTEKDRIEKLQELLVQEVKTLIFCDSIDMGKAVAKKFQIPHVYGGTKDKLNAIKENLTTVVSRVGDEGVSIEDIERVIEISWLYGSRRQELQRFTRLLHGKDTKGEGHIIMTGQQYQGDRKRLFGIMDRGFKIILHREGVSEKVVEWKEDHTPKRYSPRKAQPKIESTIEAKVEQDRDMEFELNHPILSLPGIQKKMATLNKGERNIVRLLYKKEGQEFTGEGLALLLGYNNYDALRNSVSMSKMIGMKLMAKPKPGKFIADLSLMGLSK